MRLQQELPAHMLAAPSVFAMRDTYQIFVPVDCEMLMTVLVNGEEYYDDSNGIMRSGINMHRVEVPMEALDAAGEYTVILRKMIERKPYFPTSEEPVATVFPFKPLSRDVGAPVHIYHISDAHNLVKSPIAAGQYFGDALDLLILNGDIPNHSGDIKNFNAVYEIASGVTGGTRPIVFSRGNHDTRGIHAEDFPDYTPTCNGKTYYTFRAGNVWGLVLDCGEDKTDDHAEYGFTTAFHAFRLKETAFIKDVIRRAGEEYAAPDVVHRLVICHIPFTSTPGEPFNIEQELYSEWARLLREFVKPELMICGHNHRTEVWQVGCEKDHKGQPCPVIIASKPYMPKNGAPEHFVGGAITLTGDGKIQVVFNDDEGNVREEYEL